MSGLKTLSERIIREIENEKIDSKEEVEQRKKDLCREIGLSGMPRNSDILNFADEDQKRAREILRKKPSRSVSGVANVALMTRPHACGGSCIYCPKGKDAPQSYTGKEPATRRAIRNAYDPKEQIHDRLEQFENNGHSIDKVKLIIMGGTFPFQPEDYQREFVRESYNALNTYRDGKSFDSLEKAKKFNETASIRCTGITIETRPDICDQDIIDNLLDYGVTRVEMGVQSTFEETHRKTNRGHGIQEIKESTKLLREAGMKIAYHMMLGLPGESREMDVGKFEELFENPAYRPDELKIYPCEVIEGTELYERYEKGDFEPISNDEAKSRLKEIKKKHIPKWVRIKRIMRDIPETEVSAGPSQTNLRQETLQELRKEGDKCQCIRCREIGHHTHSIDDVEETSMYEDSFKAASGDEYFFSIASNNREIIFGYLRGRTQNHSFRSELDSNTFIVRQLKVLGTATDIGSEGSVQHQGFGKRLMRRAEDKANELGCDKVSVISGVGVREYYRKLGYEKDGIYMSKFLD